MLNKNDYYTVKESMELTGWKRATIYSLCDQNKLEYFIDENKYRFILKESLDYWLEWIEEYSPIPGFSNYTINEYGDIRKIKGRNAPTEMTPKKDKDGYYHLSLRDSNGDRHWLRVHRLVAMTYLDNPEELPVVNHKNGIKDDNNVNNLEWCDISYNTKHAFEVLGRSASITTNKNCKLFKNTDLIGEFDSIKDAVDYYRDVLYGQSPTVLRKNLKYKEYTIELISNDYRNTN